MGAAGRRAPLPKHVCSSARVFSGDASDSSTQQRMGAHAACSRTDTVTDETGQQQQQGGWKKNEENGWNFQDGAKNHTCREYGNGKAVSKLQAEIMASWEPHRTLPVPQSFAALRSCTGMYRLGYGHETRVRAASQIGIFLVWRFFDTVRLVLEPTLGAESFDEVHRFSFC